MARLHKRTNTLALGIQLLPRTMGNSVVTLQPYTGYGTVSLLLGLHHGRSYSKGQSLTQSLQNHLQPGSKLNQGINVLICTKSSDQGTRKRGDQAACRRVRLSKISIYKAFCQNIKRSRIIFECNQAIKVKFYRSKILIPVANGSTDAMSVTTPCTQIYALRQEGSGSAAGQVRKLPAYLSSQSFSLAN